MSFWNGLLVPLGGRDAQCVRQLPVTASISRIHGSPGWSTVERMCKLRHHVVEKRVQRRRWLDFSSSSSTITSRLQLLKKVSNFTIRRTLHIAMLRSRTIRHSASAYFQRDYSASPKLELPHSTPWSSELEEKRIRLQRPIQFPLPQHTPEVPPPRRRRRRDVAVLLVLSVGCVLLWVFFSSRDFSTHVLDFYSSQHVHPPSPNPKLVQQPTSNHPLNPPNSPTTTTTRRRQFPPLVTKIPETRPDASLLHSGLTPTSIDAQFCNGASPCRVLLPLWIAEQESRARMHLAQVLRFAGALNRTLVLPNVGRSRVGACGRWEFDVYYDVGSFVRSGGGGGDGDGGKGGKGKVRKVMLMDDFRTWLEMRPVAPEAQMVFVDEATPTKEGVYSEDANASLISGDGLLDVHVDKDALDLGDPRLRKTRCLASKFRQLDFQGRSSLTVHITFPEHQKPLPDGDVLVRSLTRPEVVRAAAASSLAHPTNPIDSDIPEVLVVYWDIRHFPFSLNPGAATLEAVTTGNVDTGLDYSSKIHGLADRLANPHAPFLAVHWRMETVAPAMMPDCAEALVDTLATLLVDPTLGEDVKTVWFASDFPWPVSSGSGSGAAALEEVSMDFSSDEDALQQQGKKKNMDVSVTARRSNTFRTVAREHVEAIEIVKAAFRSGGSLDGWKLTGITEELDRVRREMEAEGKLWVLDEDDEEGALLEDPGVLGVLDKLVAMKAALFVSGAKRCGRVSTFTRQITEFRANARHSHAQRNIVEVFG
ncbi:hypothetical protein BXZ70DRAFT_909411 [Cristinia sonorae]|uniref:O-fucosyltransferase family protein n=1 Tax=Cristinia sonorae TaxID=1940300 RepID=A0A8K0XMQ8_9AGAR|nr:hypothetical protein BXZ70DRAFT_909411 [Cristinia sonorae]